MADFTYKNTTVTGAETPEAAQRQAVTAYLQQFGEPVEQDILDLLEVVRVEELREALADAGKMDFRNLPNWATWTGEQAADYINQEVLSGMTKDEIDTWVEANVTNLATAKTALKLVGSELVDLREICQNLARAVMYLRDVTIR